MGFVVDRTSGPWNAYLNPMYTGIDTAALWELCSLRKEGLCFDIARHLCPGVIRNIDGEL